MTTIPAKANLYKKKAEALRPGWALFWRSRMKYNESQKRLKRAQRAEKKANEGKINA